MENINADNRAVKAKKPRYSMPRIPKVKSVYAGGITTLTTLSLVPNIGFITYINFVQGSYLLALGFAGGTIGAVIRSIRTLDDRSVGRMLDGKAGWFDRLYYRLMERTPLRVLTVNRLLMRLENLQDGQTLKNSMRASREREKQAKLKNQPLTAEVRDERTFQYIKKQADKRKHLIFLLPAIVAIFAGVRLIATLETASSLLQMASRVIGYGFGLGLAFAHVDAYVLRRSREENPRPLIKLGERVLGILPTRFASRWLLRRSLHNYHDLIAGRQPLRRRIMRKIFDEVPLISLSNKLMARHDKYDYVLNDAVQSRLAETDTPKQLHDLEILFDKAAPKPVRIKDDSLKLRKAWNDFLKENEENRKRLTIEFDKYKGRTLAEADMLKFVAGKPCDMDERYDHYIPLEPAPVEQGGTMLVMNPPKPSLKRIFSNPGQKSSVVVIPVVVNPVKRSFQTV